jgi:hypothetical protein
MKCVVEIKYTFVLEAEDEYEAEQIADGAINFIVNNPQTDERITPDVDSYEKP